MVYEYVADFSYKYVSDKLYENLHIYTSQVL